jgi:hypothetical protein
MRATLILKLEGETVEHSVELELVNVDLPSDRVRLVLDHVAQQTLPYLAHVLTHQGMLDAFDKMAQGAPVKDPPGIDRLYEPLPMEGTERSEGHKGCDCCVRGGLHILPGHPLYECPIKCACHE